MKTLREYIDLVEQQDIEPSIGDDFAIEIRQDCLIESHVVDTLDDGVVIQGDDQLLKMLEDHGCLLETIRRYGPAGANQAQGYSMLENGVSEDNTGLALKAAELAPVGAMGREIDESDHGDTPIHRMSDEELAEYLAVPLDVVENDREAAERAAQDKAHDMVEDQEVHPADHGEYDREGDMAKDDLATIIRAARRLTGMLDDDENMPEWVQSKINKAADYVDTAADYIESNKDRAEVDDIVPEAKYQGREVPLGKPMRGDVKKSKVYVRGPKGNVVKVNFGDPDMKIKKSNPKRRKSFRARHNCDNPGPRWKARYWSCRAW